MSLHDEAASVVPLLAGTHPGRLVRLPSRAVRCTLDTQEALMAPKKTKKPARTERTKKSPTGFAAMDPARLRELASEGGKAAHEQGRAHVFTSEEAREAGRKGGLAAHRGREPKDSA